mmetsp:Transcript_5653/g.8781  ORF Transcript_5653/g.8781 Transcript_5653/m.8781 type:complete len:245 (-) Transcript_5653:15-749(-)
MHRFVLPSSLRSTPVLISDISTKPCASGFFSSSSVFFLRPCCCANGWLRSARFKSTRPGPCSLFKSSFFDCSSFFFRASSRSSAGSLYLALKRQCTLKSKTGAVLPFFETICASPVTVTVSTHSSTSTSPADSSILNFRTASSSFFFAGSVISRSCQAFIAGGGVNTSSVQTSTSFSGTCSTSIEGGTSTLTKLRFVSLMILRSSSSNPSTSSFASDGLTEVSFCSRSSQSSNDILLPLFATYR